MSGKYGDLINKAREPENQKTIEPESQKTIEPEKEKAVNLSIKVPEALRRHWVAEAKRQGITITAVITEALEERFGKPSDG